MGIQISLAAARVNAKMTQDDTAAALKVSKSTVVNWENGRSEPTISQARKLASMYAIPLENIIFLPCEAN